MAHDAQDPLLGTPVLGGYVITSLLGVGGMGSVYKAEHQRIGKKVAIKVLHQHMTSNRDIVQRFLAEARAASALDHPNIIEVVDAATLGDGRDYIALEFLDGDALDDYLRERKQLELNVALHILTQTCCGLEAAHHRGIIHRDLKPANLFIAPTELDPLRTKILDFGIAKLTDTVLAGDIKTGTNAIAGTPGYMAPEQARGMRDVDHRADIYALGAVAYRMMSGALPYTGDSLGEIIYQQMSGPPPDIREKRRNLPDGWANVIMACLGPEPGMRPLSARHLAMELAAATPGGLDIARRASPLLFSDAWIERNRVLVGGIHQPSAFVQAAPGGTATYQPDDPGAPLGHPDGPPPAVATPATTLSSAAGFVHTPPGYPGPPPAKRTWPALALAGGVTAAAVGGIIAIIGLAGGDDDPQALANFDASPSADAGGNIVATTTPPPQIDSGPIEPIEPTSDATTTTTRKPSKKARGDLVTIELDLSPADATVELDGVSTRPPLRLKLDSKHELVVRKRGYVTYRRPLRASADGIVPVHLDRVRKRPPKSQPKTTATTKTTDKKPDEKKPDDKKPTGPISKTLEDKKPIGPTTNEL